MSTSNDLDAPADNATVPSLAEARARLLADESLSLPRRRDMASALTSLAKAIGRPPETIAAAPATLRPLMAGLTSAMVGCRPGRWKNVLSLVTAALAHLDIVLVQGRICEAPSPAWQTILGPLGKGTGAARHFHLWRFARYCTQKSIEPAAVDDAVTAAYQQDLEQRSLVDGPARAARDAARFWNAAVDAHPDWPQQRLTVPDNRPYYALPWEAFPASLKSDVDAWCAWLGGDDPFLERDFNPLRPTSVATRLRQLREYLAALVRQGADLQQMVDLAAVVTPAQAKLGLRFFWDRAKRQKTHHTYQVAGLVLMIARHWAKLDKPDIELLRLMINQLRPVAVGISGHNAARLRQLEDPKRLEALLMLPGVLLEEVRRAGPPSVLLARRLQIAVAIEILLHVPMRLNNLRTLRIGVHLLPGSGKDMLLSIDGKEVKNGVGIEARLPEEAARLITLYVDKYRPLLATEGGDWLFPGAKGDVPKTAEGLRGPMGKMIASRCGLRMHPHLFRHMAAWLTLRENPDAHGQVQRILGHKSLTSTMAFYSGLEGAAALQHYDQLVGDLRKSALSGPNGRRRAGGGR